MGYVICDPMTAELLLAESCSPRPSMVLCALADTTRALPIPTTNLLESLFDSRADPSTTQLLSAARLDAGRGRTSLPSTTTFST